MMIAVICFMGVPDGGFRAILERDFLTETVGDRIAPVATKAAMRDPDADRRMSTLVLRHANHTDHLAHDRIVESGRDDVADRLRLFHIAHDDFVEHIVRCGRESWSV